MKKGDTRPFYLLEQVITGCSITLKKGGNGKDRDFF